MKIKEVVTIENATEGSHLYNTLLNCAQGSFAEIINGDDKNEIERIEKAFKTEINEFATKAFNMGRKYEKNKAI